MPGRVVLALLLNLSAVAVASKCSAGRKHHADLAGKFCLTSATDAASCDATCCGSNTKTCGGISAFTCPFGTYAAMDDAWKNKKTTDKTKTTDCCQTAVTCESSLYSCPAGFKKTIDPTHLKTKCPAGPKSCGAASACCVADVKTCGGYKETSVPLKNDDGAKCVDQVNFESVARADTDDAWKSKALSAGTLVKFQQECCVAKAMCSSISCKVGYIAKAGNEKLPIDEATRPKYPNGGDSCCIVDAAKTVCSTVTPVQTCPAGTYKAASLSHMSATTANFATVCCAPTATCAAAKCPAGYKMKANVATLSCHGDHLACTPICCELDKTTCGGLVATTGITCPYGFYDESALWVLSGDGMTAQATMDSWNKLPATEATKNTACCTAAAECKVEVGTTTPAPGVVTTTPSVPI